MGILQRRYAAKCAEERAARRIEEERRRAAEIEAFERDFLPTDAVAGMLGVTAVTLRRWRSAGVGPAWVKLGGSQQSKVRYPADEVRRFMADPAAYRTTTPRRGHDRP